MSNCCSYVYSGHFICVVFEDVLLIISVTDFNVCKCIILATMFTLSRSLDGMRLAIVVFVSRNIKKARTRWADSYSLKKIVG